MPGNRKQPHTAIPTVQNYDRKKKSKVAQEGTVNRSLVPHPDKKAIEVSKGRTAGKPEKNDQKLNKKRHGDQSKEQENSAGGWRTPDPKGGNL